MIIDIGDIPEDKDFDDYPDDTIFVLSEHARNPRKYNQKDFLEHKKLVPVEPGEPGYALALSKEDLYKLAKETTFS